MENQDYLSYFANIIEKRIASAIPATEPKEIYTPFRYIMTGGGKRMRPLLAMLACGAVSGNCLNSLDAAVAIEIIHNFTLAHDDVMDNSPMRRGRETVHKKWDVPTAILTGDIMVGYAYKLLNQYKNHENYKALVDTMNYAVIGVCEGQAYDMKYDGDTEITLDDYFKMTGLKTSVLIQSAVRLGGLVGNASEDQLDALDRFAHGFGLAFQLQDDLLDITADQSKFGKPIGQDILEGKKTYLILKSQKLAKENSDIELINEYMHSSGFPASKIPVMKNLFERLGVFDAAQNDIDKMIHQAESALSGFEKNEFTLNLLNLAETFKKRNK